MNRDEAFKLLRGLFGTAVAAAQPDHVMERFLPKPVAGRTVVVGAGKASAAMARAFEAAWQQAGHGELQGLVVTQYGYAVSCEAIEIIEAGHPVPDANSVAAAQHMLALAEGLDPNDQLVALMSGGGSALLCAPAGNLDLADKQALNDALLHSGATIAEMNCVRKHFSAIKGGRLAAAASPAQVVSLILSDIPGDIRHLVASGPTLADDAGRDAAREIIQRYPIKLPPSLANWLDNPRSAAPKPQNEVFKSGHSALIGSAQISLEAAAVEARQHGFNVHILSDRIEGEAREIGREQAEMAIRIKDQNHPFASPCVVLSGGETTVTVRHRGKGGRNAEFLLGFALAIAEREGIYALAADTDGRDGTEQNAGALCDGTTISTVQAAGQDAHELLARNDAWTAFNLCGGLVETGPTGTNVNDFRAIVIA